MTAHLRLPGLPVAAPWLALLLAALPIWQGSSGQLLILRMYYCLIALSPAMVAVNYGGS